MRRKAHQEIITSTVYSLRSDASVICSTVTCMKVDRIEQTRYARLDKMLSAIRRSILRNEIMSGRRGGIPWLPKLLRPPMKT